MWHHNAIVYAIDPKVFQDTNGDGVGDLAGVRDRLDYLAELGVTCIWLQPFYPSPWRDNGYDVLDYYSVDPRLGTIKDFEQIVQQAHQRGIKVIIDLVIHHTSDQHPWFQQARHDPTSRFREYYVWSPTIPEGEQQEPIFPSEEDGVWTYEDQAGAFYHHRFYHFQPDLNIANPDVQDEILKIMDYWLEFGIDGFRIDAASHLAEYKGVPGTGLEQPAEFFEKMHQLVVERNSEAVLLGETDVVAQQIKTYFGRGERFQLLFNFLQNNTLFAALAQGAAQPLKRCFEGIPQPPPEASWLNFVRNHDELDLERLPEDERQHVMEVFAPRERMRIYGRGIRRRLAPMLSGDRQRLRFVWAVLLGLPGASMILYGDEIGLGEDLSLDERNAVRIPMQWSDDKNAGFSTVDTNQLFRPVMSETQFGYEHVNVAQQRAASDSLWRFIQKLISLKKEHSILGTGEYQVLKTAPEVLGLSYEDRLVVFYNFSSSEVKIDVEDDLSEKETLLEVRCRRDGENELWLGEHGCWWGRSKTGPI